MTHSSSYTASTAALPRLTLWMPFTLAICSTRLQEIGTSLRTSASPLIEARAHHTATLMGDGKALVVGGYNGRDAFARRYAQDAATRRNGRTA